MGRCCEKFRYCAPALARGTSADSDVLTIGQMPIVKAIGFSTSGGVWNFKASWVDNGAKGAAEVPNYQRYAIPVADEKSIESWSDIYLDGWDVPGDLGKRMRLYYEVELVSGAGDWFLNVYGGEYGEG